MFKIPMIGEPLLIEKKKSFCEHNKLPQVIQSVIYQNPAIRLKEMSRLRKLGEREYRTCSECNEHICACLWTKSEHKPPPLDERNNVTKSKVPSMPREYRVGKGWSLRNQILDKFRESFRCAGNQQKDDKRLKSKDSCVWLLRPTKKLRVSETNILRPDISKSKPKHKQLPQRTQQKSMPYKYQINTQSAGSLSSRTQLYNWQARLARQQATNERITIQKGTKEYFNACQKMHEIKLMESQLEKALCSQYNNNVKTRTAPPTTQYHSYTKINELNSLEKLFEKQQNDFIITHCFNSKEYLDEILGKYSANSAMEPFGGENLPKCNCEQCKLKTDNIKRQQEPNYEYTMLEMASSSSSEAAATYDICNSAGNICDYMWLKRTDTQIKLSNQPAEGIQISTQTSNILVAEASVSHTSMNVNFSESCSRMADFESELGPDQESELAKEMVLAKEGELAKELKSPQEEKEATSVTKIDNDDVDDDDEEGATSSKSKKIQTKKHKHKKFKNTRTKKQRTQAPNIATIETLKSIENVIETESNELVTPGISDNQVNNIDNFSMDLTSMTPEDMLGNVDYVGLQGTTKQNIKHESYNICYHRPIKYVKKKVLDDVYSTT